MGIWEFMKVYIGIVGYMGAHDVRIYKGIRKYMGYIWEYRGGSG